ncbi:hypothetical protein K435DRAFT_789365 [Dendrothele bispora CBS 962.96]|uniref:Uncharacterized protein n=1 Tax=Dendrothele bispora (strain CBS 962.96) TaxID=1314807 RepID=A0A4S8MU97_DENBC|nr:hypothetical protein K435DRAFT_789365 [Dendrothele bispora CBS 962.96]
MQKNENKLDIEFEAMGNTERIYLAVLGPGQRICRSGFLNRASTTIRSRLQQNSKFLKMLIYGCGADCYRHDANYVASRNPFLVLTLLTSSNFVLCYIYFGLWLGHFDLSKLPAKASSPAGRNGLRALSLPIPRHLNVSRTDTFGLSDDEYAELIAGVVHFSRVISHYSKANQLLKFIPKNSHI